MTESSFLADVVKARMFTKNMSLDGTLTATAGLIEADRRVTPARGRRVTSARHGTATLAVPVIVGGGVVIREVAPDTPAPEVEAQKTQGLP